MTIDVQQPNYAGLVALAGKNAALNIAPTGALGLQALQQSQANQASMRDDAARRVALQQQGQLGLLSNHTQNRALDIQAQQQQRQGLLAQNELGLKQQQLGMQNSQFQDEMGFKKDQLNQQGAEHEQDADLKNRILAEDTAKRQMAELLAEKKEQIQEKGAFASYGLLAISGAESTEEANQIRSEILKEAGSKGFMKPEEIKAASQMPISQFQNGLKYKLMQYGQVNEYKAMVDTQKPAADKSGTQIQMDANGNIASINVSPTMASKTKTEETINDRSQALLKLGELQKNFDPSYFTNLKQGENWLSKQAEVNKGIPLVGTGLDKAAEMVSGKKSEDRAADIQKFTDYANSVEQFFNQTYKQPMTGAAVGEEELKKLRSGYLSGDMSASEYKGALDQLIRKYAGEAEYNKNYLRKGVDVTPGPSVTDDGLRQYFKQHGKSDAEIDTWFKNRGNK